MRAGRWDPHRVGFYLAVSLRLLRPRAIRFPIALIFSSARTPSVSLKNIEIGIERGMWAVANIEEPYATARRTRAQHMPVGAAGLFYCSRPKVFTVPFRVESRPEDRTIDGVWDERWYLPFSIR